MTVTNYFDEDSDDLSSLQADLYAEHYSLGYLKQEQIDILNQKLQILRRAINKVRSNLFDVVYEHPYWRFGKDDRRFQEIIKLSDCENNKLDYLVKLADQLEMEIYKLSNTSTIEELGDSKFKYKPNKPTPKPRKNQPIHALQPKTIHLRKFNSRGVK